MAKGQGRPPRRAGQKTVPERSLPTDDGYPMLSLRHLCRGFGVEEMTQNQRSEFLLKWAKRSAFTWRDLNLHRTHALGYEMLPSEQIKPCAPEALEQDRYMVFRHEGNYPFAGFKAGDTFYVLWVETQFGDLYDHGN